MGRIVPGDLALTLVGQPGQQVQGLKPLFERVVGGYLKAFDPDVEGVDDVADPESECSFEGTGQPARGQHGIRLCRHGGQHP